MNTRAKFNKVTGQSYFESECERLFFIRDKPSARVAISSDGVYHYVSKHHATTVVRLAINEPRYYLLISRETIYRVPFYIMLSYFCTIRKLNSVIFSV